MCPPAPHWSQWATWKIYTQSIIISLPCSDWVSVFHLSQTTCETKKESPSKYKMWRLSPPRMLTQQDFNVSYTGRHIGLSPSSLVQLSISPLFHIMIPHNFNHLHILWNELWHLIIFWNKSIGSILALLLVVFLKTEALIFHGAHKLLLLCFGLNPSHFPCFWFTCVCFLITFAEELEHVGRDFCFSLWSIICQCKTISELHCRLKINSHLLCVMLQSRKRDPYNIQLSC